MFLDLLALVNALFFSMKLSDRCVIRTQKSAAFLHTNRARFHCHPFSRTGLHCACLSRHGFRSCAVWFLISSLDFMWFVNAGNLPCPLPWFAVVASLGTVGPFSSFPPIKKKQYCPLLARRRQISTASYKRRVIIGNIDILIVAWYSPVFTSNCELFHYLAGHFLVLHSKVSSPGFSPPQ